LLSPQPFWLAIQFIEIELPTFDSLRQHFDRFTPRRLSSSI
jgi:hypothetical protein